MTILRATKRRQRDWAASHGIAVDRNGYVADESENFHLPLSPGFSAALDAAGGGERQTQRHRPAKIRALHSSAVLAINVFQYWEGRRGSALPAALGFPGELESVSIEQPFDAGLRGTPPTLDVVLSLPGDRIVAIESKFTEWMTKKRIKSEEFRAKYLPPGKALWADAGLPGCQALASAIADGTESFRQLDALQLLKHALGLARSRPGRFSLVYLYYDGDGDGASDVARRHHEEIERFGERVGGETGFRGMSYQQLFPAIEAATGVDDAYIAYLKQRYFPV